jgi:hypothetical protein
MLMHWFCVFQFKFAFEFVCLKCFQKDKTLFSSSPSFSSNLARFVLRPNSQSPTVPLFLFPAAARRPQQPSPASPAWPDSSSPLLSDGETGTTHVGVNPCGLFV